MSFAFMGNFRKKLKNKRDFINILLFQKCEALNNLYVLFGEKAENEQVLANFSSNTYYHEYRKLEPDEFYLYFSYTQTVYNAFQKLYISEKIEDENKLKIQDMIKTIDDINTKYNENVQYYNMDAIAFNYWRNVFSTKWIKKLFKVKEVKELQ